MKLLFIRQVWTHHASRSGYDTVFKSFKGKDVDFIFMKQAQRGDGLFLRILQFLFPKHKNHLSVRLFLTELKILIRAIFFKPDVIHFTYLQHDFIVFKYAWLRPKAKLVATIHLPPFFWKEKKQSWHNFQYLDQIIVLDQASLIFFSQKEMLQKKLTCIPHPVDTSYFYPEPTVNRKDNKIHCLFVGRFLRNIELFFDIVEYCNEHQPSIVFHFSYPNTNSEHSRLSTIIQLDNVQYVPYLAEEDLRKLYQSCDVLVQPLIDSTVNNVIIEAIACGLPVVVNELPALETYLDESVAIICENNLEAFVDGILIAKHQKMNHKHQLLSIAQGKNALEQLYRGLV